MVIIVWLVANLRVLTCRVTGAGCRALANRFGDLGGMVFWGEVSAAGFDGVQSDLLFVFSTARVIRRFGA